MQIEQWRSVPESDFYEVSNHGRVRSWAIRGHEGKRAKVPHLITPYPNPGGYMLVRIHRKMRQLHRLVLMCFVGSPPFDGAEGCHNDGNPKNNRLDNLRWDTKSGNQRDRMEHGTSNRGKTYVTGDQLPQAKLSYSLVDRIRKEFRPEVIGTKERRKLGLPTQRELAKRYGVAPSVMSRAINGKTWASSLEEGGQ